MDLPTTHRRIIRKREKEIHQLNQKVPYLNKTHGWMDGWLVG
jgi:hypothetical protein